MDEISGTQMKNVKESSNENVCPNPGFEFLSGGAEVWTYWSKGESNGGTVVDETVDVHSGAHAVKVTAGTASAYNTRLMGYCGSNVGYLSPPLIAGQTYTFKFWCHGDGTANPTFDVLDVTHGYAGLTGGPTGITGLVYQQYTTTFTVPAGCVDIQMRFYGTTVNGVTYWDDFEIIPSASTNPTAGNYRGATLGQPGIGDGRKSPLFDGINDWANLRNADGINTAAEVNQLQALLEGNEGTLAFWARTTDAGIWTEAGASAYSLLSITTVTPPASLIYFEKWMNENNVISIIYAGMGTQVQLYAGIPIGTDTNWFHLCLTWSLSHDRVKVFVNAAANNHPSWEGTGLGAWTITKYPAYIDIASRYGGTMYRWPGNMAHLSFWDVELSEAEALALYRGY
jgi:hypothetical protein